ncbi:hypothetical protein ACQPYK_01565 [Streptosporangium sp. CA-135522]|uniref:hypothetical protein n=1 Tax=Streptosporangium sp. CA-135522 TaxID=3240072 RepID=UPI003D8D6E08
MTGIETARANDMAAFSQRLQASGLSRWELADFLGIHPHELDRTELNDLRERPVKVVIELARRLDMHPADLINELDAVLVNPRTIASDPLAPIGPPPPEPGMAADAMTLLSALARAPYPLTAAELARTLSLGLARMHAALDHIAAHPELGGPMALRRIPPQTYTLTPRVDILNAHQQSMIAYPRFPHSILAVEQTDVLYAALAFGPLPASPTATSILTPRNVSARPASSSAGRTAKSASTTMCCSASDTPHTTPASTRTHGGWSTPHRLTQTKTLRRRRHVIAARCDATTTKRAARKRRTTTTASTPGRPAVQGDR